MPKPHANAHRSATAHRRAALEAIRAARGMFKRKPGEKPVTQELIEERAEEVRLEEAKWQRFDKCVCRKQKLAK